MKVLPAVPDTGKKSVWEALGGLIQTRVRAHFSRENGASAISLPSVPEDTGFLEKFILENKLGRFEYWAILMALAPHVQPHFWDTVIQEALPQAGDFQQIGGVRGKQYRGFLPTGETVLFVLAGENWEERLKVMEIFSPEHVFSQKKILLLELPPDGEPILSGKLVLNPVYIPRLTTGRDYLPHFSIHFPAQQLKTEMTWKDVVLNPLTLKQIDELRTWLEHKDTLMNKMGMGRLLRPGYRALFYGPPGTGKTISATLLGKEYRYPVFRVDLSLVVSKYIGETEKNLSRLFDEAEHLKCILFFDEADALFGKRTQVKDAHDRFANQEVSYLMQRIEMFEGLVILASNLKGNMDEAFTRRFQSIIYFPYPTPEEQLAIWGKAFPDELKPARGVDLKSLVQRYKLSGSNILNIVSYCVLTALANGATSISAELLQAGIQRELQKEGKTY
jgi:hypothetical protein